MPQRLMSDVIEADDVCLDALHELQRAEAAYQSAERATSDARRSETEAFNRLNAARAAWRKLTELETER